MHIDNKVGFVGNINNSSRIEYWPWDQGQRGWTCPKCGTVYSPYINICMTCSNPPIQPKIPTHPSEPNVWNIDVWSAETVADKTRF